MDEKTARRLEVPLKWNGKCNVCAYCGSVPEIFYIITGHDHTDDDITWCPCRENQRLTPHLNPHEIWEQIALEKEVAPVVDRIMAEYNTETKAGIRAAIRQAVWEGMCTGRGWK